MLVIPDGLSVPVQVIAWKDSPPKWPIMRRARRKTLLTHSLIPDVEILAVRLFTGCFNALSDGANIYGSRGGGVWGIRSLLEDESCKIMLGTVFLWGLRLRSYDKTGLRPPSVLVLVSFSVLLPTLLCTTRRCVT